MLAAVEIQNCWSCARSFCRKVVVGRFCSQRCKDWCDAGNPPHGAEPPGNGPWRVVAGGDPGYLPKTPMKATASGFKISCAGCQKEFESLGLRCCSSGCERRYRERVENRAIMSEAGMEPATKRKCEECGGNVPRWTGAGKKRRAVPVTTRFCSRDKANRG